MSWPAEKCLPVPARTITFTASSSTARWNARSSAYVIREFCALRYSGRSMVTTAVDPRTLYATGSSSDMRELLAQNGLQDLAGRVPGQVVDELDPPRHLVVGEPVPAEREHVVGRHLRVGPPHHERETDLAEALVGNADDGRLGDAGQPGQRLLDLGRVDVEASADVHVLQPVGDRQVAGVVERADVAGVQPAVGVDRGRGGLRVVEVPEHDVGPAEQQFAVVADARLEA